MLILAFLVAILHAAGAQDPSDCPSGILPGVNYIGNGFDVVTGERKALSVINISYTARQTVSGPDTNTLNSLKYKFDRKS